jgi:MYXO-CTERM domain-containing protein
MRRIALPLFASLLTLSAAGFAQPAIHDDANPAAATIDGALTMGEYGSFTSGINTSFGGMLGANVEVHVKSAADGSLAFLIDETGQNCTLGADDSIVFYIDSRAGGFASTQSFTDVGDGGRAAASGRGTSSGTADLTFAPGFTADFALVVRADSATLYSLTSGGAHTFVKSATQAPMVSFGSACVKEIGGITMADLGSAAGRPFDYVGTLINASNAVRSNEFQGVAASTIADTGNIGASPFALAAGDFDTYQSYAATPALVMPKRVFAFSHYRGAGFQPSATVLPTQLSSDVFAATGWSDGALAFGGTQITAMTDYTRGAVASAQMQGGFYSMAVAARPDGNAFGIQPGTSDFAPGSLTIRLSNSTGSPLYGFDLDLRLFERNDAARSSSFDTSYSTDGTNFSTILTHTTPVAAVAMAPFTPVAGMSTSVTNATIPANGQLFIRFTSADVAGSGSRDELAIDAVIIKPLVSLCPMSISDGNVCTQDVCDPATGVVTHPPESSTTLCDDGSLCTGMDTCNGSGSCVGTAVVCMPPAPVCLNATTSRTQSNGVCDLADGICDFTILDTNCPNGCVMATGLCSGDPCNLVTCDMPPAPTCVNGTTSASYAAMGTCDSSNGMCSYAETQSNCPAGCNTTTGLCNGDPCATVTCDMTPGPCFETNGTCNSMDGMCTYAPLANGTTCDDADATTDNDVCDGNGVCAGTPAGTGGGGVGGGGTGGAGGGGTGGSTSGTGGGTSTTTSGSGGGTSGSGGSPPTTSGAGGGDGGTDGGDSGCGCVTAGEPASTERPVALVLAGLGALVLRRRKRSAR